MQQNIQAIHDRIVAEKLYLKLTNIEKQDIIKKQPWRKTDNFINNLLQDKELSGNSSKWAN